MSIPTTKQQRILAIDPGTRYVGFCVLQDTELLAYGVKDFRAKRPAYELLKATRTMLGHLINRYHPHVLAYEKSFYVQTQTSALLQVEQQEIITVGTEAQLMVYGYLPVSVRSALCENGKATKEAVADHLVNRYPELARYRFRPGSLQALYWFHMFDALAVAVVCAEELSRPVTSDDSRHAA